MCNYIGICATIRHLVTGPSGVAMVISIANKISNFLAGPHNVIQEGVHVPVVVFDMGTAGCGGRDQM